MGQRANLILIENGQHSVFYSHWCAASMRRDLFWGPEYAAVFVKAQEPVEDGKLLDEVWAEGGVVLDRDAKTLLLFGGEDEMYDVPLRRLYLALLQSVWKGWNIQWAYGGVADLADGIGYPREKVLCPDQERLAQVVLEPRTLSGCARTVGSARMPDERTRFYPLMGRPIAYLLAGSHLLDAVERYSGVASLNLDRSAGGFPWGGFHLDLVDKLVEFWIAHPTAEVQQRVAFCWPDWTVRWHRDCFEFQLERASGLLQFPVLPRSELLSQIRANLMYEDKSSMVNVVMGMVEDKRFSLNLVNPHALREAQLIVPKKERERIVAQAIAALGTEG